MIRANLLPVSRDSWAFFGGSFDRRAGAHLALCALAVFFAGGIAFAAQHVRLAIALGEAQRLEERVLQNAGRREHIRTTAADVARLQQLLREAESRRLSGNEIAATLAAIGNAVPAPVWLEGIDRRSDGFVVTGGAETLDQVGDTLVSVARTMPAAQPSLGALSLDERGKSLHFSLVLRAPAQTETSR